MNFKNIVFSHVRLYDNNSRWYLCSNPNWAEHFINKQYFYKDTVDKFRIDSGSLNFFPWSCFENNSERYEDLRNDFNIKAGISICKKHDQYYDFFHFGSPIKNLNFYLAQIECFTKFIPYFKEKAKKLIAIAEQNKIVYHPPQKLLSSLQQTLEIQKKQRELFLKQIPTNHFAHKTINCLTPRENECVTWLNAGKTADETGIILNISKRTVEKHLENIRKKLNCYKQTQIVQIMSEMIS
ncbi:MAG: helix-turn-helix transcriptional regulator [Gammaproteobacteria bacterium]|nr:helix-turn-helix transcriptional regulator [Gammaproteobacteria bacterium]